ncbi:MAG: O-succinylbenzoic acid--CoA ligase, partial [Bacteroidia bacterium]|nr:O-succinylbenzoic acid--CoA ligase [Bacteroidia bacterium]
DYVGNIKNILVGGAVVSRNLKAKIQTCPANIFETYGMTETITHIAARRLNNFDRSPLSKEHWHHFTALPEVNISKDLRGCLVIDAPYVSSKELITNDLVTIHSDRTFDWLGRIDNVINSGGVKIFPEQIESKLSEHMDQRYLIAAEEDDALGQRVILVVEGKVNTVDEAIFKVLDKFEVPKQIYYIPTFVDTFSGKVQREETLKLLE